MKRWILKYFLSFLKSVLIMIWSLLNLEAIFVLISILSDKVVGLKTKVSYDYNGFNKFISIINFDSFFITALETYIWKIYNNVYKSERYIYLKVFIIMYYFNSLIFLCTMLSN